ncbi:secretory 1A [Prunus dulcis]|uniref:Secretory 1A n=1 Tax=Prunus dulcis TaxID=3755 RepID=A0A4Y1QZX2_PRUDU|nr:secretory 1A [Prunus dulcis]
MLGSTRTEKSKSWKVLIMDKITVKVMSHSCKMADITDQEISLVEDLFRRREPLPSMDVIYFIQPTKEKYTCSIVMFLSDMSGREPLYRNSPIPKELVNHIKSDTSVLPRIGALREMNFEYFPADSQAFTTDQERTMEELFGNFVNARRFDACLNIMATRIATVFASLKELPFVRYRSAKALDESTEPTPSDLVATKLAATVWDIISKYKSSIPNFPQKETCDLLILDRSVDQIAPVIHEWTYDAMCHDLLDMDGNKYKQEVPSKTGGDPEKKEVLLEDNDPVWLELRHTHIADASERLHDKFTNFASKNKAAQLQQSAREGNELSTRDLQKMVQALPQYTEQVDKISLHVEDLVFGDAGAKDVINYLRTNQDTTPENKLRLLMIYASVYPEKFEGDKATKLMQLAKLSSEDMKVVNNMRLLGGSSESKKTSSSFSLKFNAAKTKQAARKDRVGEEETWQLSRFYPMIEELIENLNKGELPKNDSPRGSLRGSRSSSAQMSQPTTAPHSMRSRRTANWGRARHSDDGYSSDSALRGACTDFKKMGQRIFVFMIGGATRSELRVCHKLTTKLRREVILGTTSIIESPQYITIHHLSKHGCLSSQGPKKAWWLPNVKGAIRMLQHCNIESAQCVK